MAKIRTTCHICRYSEKGKTALKVCYRCKTNLVNPDEELLKYTQCTYAWGKDSISGDGCSLYLTNKRLIIVHHFSSMTYSGGIIGELIASAKSRHENKMDSVSLEDIVSYGKSILGVMVPAFTINLKDKKLLRLSARPAQEWIDAIKEAKADFSNAKKKRPKVSSSNDDGSDDVSEISSDRILEISSELRTEINATKNSDNSSEINSEES
ncbi:MAG: hypothetical protein FWG88_01335 [Oscillospiraceae bacterium]|nr:hypothetical protein [Oscillospiraceae bacterium]